MADLGAKRDSLAAGDFVLHCRGDVRLYGGSADCTPKSRKGRALLAILAAEQRPLSRVRIIDLLWSDRQEEQARASLRTLLADLKEQFGGRFDELLLVDRERVALAPGVRTDLSDPALARPASELFEGLDHIDPELDEWLRTERKRWSAAASPAPRPVSAESASPRRLSLAWAIAAAVALLAAAALFYFWSAGPARTPVVAVLKIQDTTGRNALLSDAIAEEIRLGLAQNPGIEVIGRSSSEDPSIVSGGASAVATRLGASHIVEGSIVPRGRDLQLAVRLLDATSGRTLWDGAGNASGADLAVDASQLAEGITGYLTDVLSRRVPSRAFRADANTWAALLEARAAIAQLGPEQGARQREALQNMIRSHPDFVPALVALSQATMLASDHVYYRGTLPLEQARREAASHARRAIAIAPEYAPAYDALASAYRDMDEALPLLRRAVALAPGFATAHRNLAWELERHGDFAAALDHWRTAARLDPLDIRSHGMLARQLDMAGRREEMRTLLTAFAGRVSDPFARWGAESLLPSYSADISHELISYIQAERIEPDNVRLHRALGFTLEWLFGPESASPYAGPPDSFNALLLARDTRAIIRKVEASGPDFFRLNFETTKVAEHLGWAGRRDVLVRAFDRARTSENPPTVEGLSGAGPQLILGLREAGRGREAEGLLAGLEAELGRVRGVRAEYLDNWGAKLDMLRGRHARAAARLYRALRGEWDLDLHNFLLPAHEFNVFAPIRNDPRIVELRRRYQREMAREAREAIDEMVAAGIRPRRCRNIPGVCPARS